MLIALVCMVVLFVIGRFVVVRSNGSQLLAIGVGALTVLSFAAGFAERQAFFPSDSAAAPPVTGTGPTAPAPSVALLSASAMARLTANESTAAMGHIDGITADVPSEEPEDFRRPTSLIVDGWAADPAARAPGARLLAIVDRHIRVDLTPYYHVSRPDVAKAYNAPSLQFAGVSHAPISVGNLAPGQHNLQLAVVSADQQKFYLVQPEATITILK